MNDQEFKQIREKFDEMAAKELDDRGPSYAENADRLANFKALGAELGISPMQVLMVYLKKHMRSIERYVRDGHQTSEGVITNFVGARNYLDLAVALMKDLEASKTSVYYKPVITNSTAESATYPVPACKNCGHANLHQWGTETYRTDFMCQAPECYCVDYETN